MKADAVIKIKAHAQCPGGKVVDNHAFSKLGLKFKGGVEATPPAIEQRIGVKTRYAADHGVLAGAYSFEKLLESQDFDPGRIKVVIVATNGGDAIDDPGPFSRHISKLINQHCPDAMVFDLYAGCPGFNVSAEILFAMSLSGRLNKGDMSVIVGYENLLRSDIFKNSGTAMLIFGDDALSTLLETYSNIKPEGQISTAFARPANPDDNPDDKPEDKSEDKSDSDYLTAISRTIIDLCDGSMPDGIIVDNQLGDIAIRLPAVGARLQAKAADLLYPEEAKAGVFKKFNKAIEFFDQNLKSFAFDIMSPSDSGGPGDNSGSNSGSKSESPLEAVAKSYIESGKCSRIVTVFLDRDKSSEVTLYTGKGFRAIKPESGIIDSRSVTHGCFGEYIEFFQDNNDIGATMNGKGVFLYAARSAEVNIKKLLSRNSLNITDIDLLIEHQANFALIRKTIELLVAGTGENSENFISRRMPVNIHYRGNCSVPVMQRLHHDLMAGTLLKDDIQGITVNGNTEELKNAKTILFDSVGAGMSRSSFLYKE